MAIELNIADQLAHLHLNRPKALNALSVDIAGKDRTRLRKKVQSDARHVLGREPRRS